jgi:hypothetical protein
MKRALLIKHLRKNNCVLHKEGAKHSILSILKIISLQLYHAIMI